MFRVKSIVVPAMLLMITPGLALAARMEQPDLGDGCEVSNCDEVDEVDHGQGDPNNSFLCSYAPWADEGGNVEFALREELFDCTEAGYSDELDPIYWDVQKLYDNGVPYGVRIDPLFQGALDLSNICVSERNPAIKTTRLTVERNDLIAKFAKITETPSWFGNFDITLNGVEISVPVIGAWGNAQSLNQLIIDAIRAEEFQVAESAGFIRVTQDPMASGIYEIQINSGENTGLTATGLSLEPSNAFDFLWCFPPPAERK